MLAPAPRKRDGRRPAADRKLGRLARRVRGSQLGVGRGPDALDAAAGAQKEGSGGQRYESHQQCVFNQVLALFVSEKVYKQSQVCHLRMSLRSKSGSHKYLMVRLWELIGRPAESTRQRSSQKSIMGRIGLDLY